jgi:DNA invertase Pin-like site-specific DNA recombinase
MKRVAIYARVSTDKQTCENQLIELRAVAERCGYTIVTEFVDTGISGAKGRADRPALNEMMKAATQRCKGESVYFLSFYIYCIWQNECSAR